MQHKKKKASSIKVPQRCKVRQIKDAGWQKAYHEKPSPLSKT
jgi:hypothetical protein